MSRHLLDITDLSAEELRTILHLAQRVDLPRPLEGLGVALIFEKPSNRTRQSMEMAVFQLGGHPVYTRGEEVGFDVRESAEDITHVMAGYHGMLAARGSPTRSSPAWPRSVRCRWSTCSAIIRTRYRRLQMC